MFPEMKKELSEKRTVTPPVPPALLVRRLVRHSFSDGGSSSERSRKPVACPELSRREGSLVEGPKGWRDRGCPTRCRELIYSTLDDLENLVLPDNAYLVALISCAVPAEAVESINAELRRGGPLVGRMSRRVSQSGLRKNRIQGFNRGPLRQRQEGGATCGPLR